MPTVEISHRLDTVARRQVDHLLAAVADHDRAQPLSDHLVMDMHDPASTTFTGLLARGHRGELDGYAQLQPNNGVWSLAAVVTPSQRAEQEVLAELLAASLAEVGRAGGGEVNWWVLDAGLAGADVAAAIAMAGGGLTLGRELHQMRRTLPIDRSAGVTVRPFVVGGDEDAWLSVNNRAFAGHAEQGGWTREQLAQREREPWFDPAGFLLHERDGRLAAFCWTKVHDDTMSSAGPRMGEIYAIAVDPDFPGLGLGTALTVAGLEHLGGQGLTVGMLYVDAGNTGAVTMYDRLGFTVHHTDRAYLGNVEAAR
ncbi:MAG: mycothiol synthase [Ilumatobacteraceae bacterium]